MKLRIFILLLFLFSMSSVQAETKMEKVVIKTKIYCDHCKECGSCQARLEHDLSFEKGIASVRLDVENQNIEIEFNPSKTDLTKIREAISQTGFDADDVKADAKAYDKLDDCCKKSN